MNTGAVYHMYRERETAGSNKKYSTMLAPEYNNNNIISQFKVYNYWSKAVIITNPRRQNISSYFPIANINI